MKDKLMLVLDASALAHSSCMYKLYRTTVNGYKSQQNTINIEFGTAFHKFRHTFRETKDFAAACFRAKEHLETTPCYVPKLYTYLQNVGYLLMCCSEYADLYSKDSFTPMYLELRFCFPYYVDDEIELLLAGTMDEIGTWSNSINGICDCKTSSTPEYKIDQKLKSYTLSGQLLFYHWCLRQYGKEFPETKIGEICNYDIGMFVDGVFPQNKTKVLFKRSATWLPQSHITEAYDKMIREKLSKIIQEFKLCHANGTLPARDGILHGTCTQYNLCNFFDSCAAPDEFSSQTILDRYMIKHPYNPLEHQE